MSLLLPFNRSNQPQQFVVPSGPFARGLIFAAIPGDRSIALSPAQPVVSGSSTVVVGRGGRGARAPSTQVAGYVGYSSNLSIAASQDYTLAAFCIPSSESTTGSTPTQDFIGAQLNYLSIGSNGFRAYIDNNTTALNAYTKMDPALFMATRRGSTISAYVPSGAVVTAATGTRAQTFTTICAGRYSGNNHTDTETYLLLVWNRGIGLDEYLALSKNVWQIFTPQPGRIWIPSASGVIHTVSYSDVGTVLDTVSCLYITPKSLSESSTPLDNITASLISSRTYTEVATTNSSFSANTITASTYLETVTGVDTYTAYVAGSSSSYDEISTPLDTYTVSLTTSVVYTETSGVLDTYTLPVDPLTLTQADIDAIANAVWAHPWALNLPKWLALK